MPLYEIMCIATLQSTPQQLVNTLQRLAVVVQKGKGVFRRVENLGTRPLAYRMKAHMKYNTVGRFVRLFIQASPLLCRDVETRLRVDDNIVRTMTIKHQQVAPVVIEKRARHRKIANLTSTTGILTHPPSVEYEAAKLLLSLNYLRSSDILGLQRHEEDAEWEARRKAEIIKRAEGGSAEARAQLQMKVPTRQDDLAHMKLLGDAEEEEMQAYESYRKARNARQVTDQETYDADEEAAMQRRKDWYNSAMQVSRDWGLAKKLNKWRKPKSEEQVRKLVEGHPKRWYPNHKAKNPFDNPRANQGQAQEEELVDDLEEDVEAPTEQAAAAAKQ